MYIPVELDKVRNFRYGMKAISYIELQLKQPISKINFDGLTMYETALIICAGLIHEDNTLTPDKVMDLIDEKGNFNEVMEAMSQAFAAAFGNGNDSKN